MKPFSRRGFLKAMGIGVGAVVGARLPGSSLVGVARAATPEPTSVVCVYLEGGINAILTGADAFTNTAFGVNGGNITNIGGGVVVDNTMASAIPEGIRNHVACVGVRHGITDHGNAQRSLFMSGNQSAPLVLANAIGGNGAIKAAVVGDDNLPNLQRPAPVNGVSLQPIRDMRATIEAIAGAASAPNVADRAGTAKGIAAAQAMSKTTLQKHANSLASLDQGYSAAVATLGKPVQPFSVDDFNQAYGLNGTGVGLGNFRSQMAAAELMVRAGTNFVIAQDFGWDTHNDTSGNEVRNKMNRIGPPLRTFLTRMVQDESPNRNVVVVIMGDFSRSLPTSDHQANLSVLLIGKTIKNATTGRTDQNVGLPAGTPSIPGLWQVLAAAARVDTNPFGANPHSVLV
ncbi:MAG: DUF1501 domain-containing protein [Labilithrix sp.]|nr:DUF1501 domain-containing protein [Labilithrix sp.]